MRRSLGVIAVVTAVWVANLSFGKTVVPQTSALNNSPLQKANFLNFPSLPKDVLERDKSSIAKAKLASKPNTDFSKDWPLSNIGFFDIFTPLIQPIRSQIEACSPRLVVAIVDTGVDYTHPDLKDNLWVNAGETGKWEPPANMAHLTSCRDKSCNGIDDDGNGFVDDVIGWDFVNDVPLPWDVHGHGTHIAGIVASKAGNGGNVGVCPTVSFMALKYYDNTGIGYNNLQNTVRAFQYASRNGANIINYSGGGAEPAASERAALEEAEKKGILLVAAAGNDGHNNDQIPYFPASYPLSNIISVASVNRDNQLLTSSNFGSRSVNIAAPGLQILSTLPGGKYGMMSGTSQATAFVTGAAALLASQYKEPSQIDYKKIKTWLSDGAKPIANPTTHKNLVSGGLLSLAKSVQILKEDMAKKTPIRSDIALKRKN